jgi:hypothetical protein
MATIFSAPIVASKKLHPILEVRARISCEGGNGAQSDNDTGDRPADAALAGAAGLRR